MPDQLEQIIIQWQETKRRDSSGVPEFLPGKRTVNIDEIVFELESLPDFSSSRFNDLFQLARQDKLKVVIGEQKAFLDRLHSQLRIAKEYAYSFSLRYVYDEQGVIDARDLLEGKQTFAPRQRIFLIVRLFTPKTGFDENKKNFLRGSLEKALPMLLSEKYHRGLRNLTNPDDEFIKDLAKREFLPLGGKSDDVKRGTQNWTKAKSEIERRVLLATMSVITPDSDTSNSGQYKPYTYLAELIKQEEIPDVDPPRPELNLSFFYYPLSFEPRPHDGQQIWRKLNQIGKQTAKSDNTNESSGTKDDSKARTAPPKQPLSPPLMIDITLMPATFSPAERDVLRYRIFQGLEKLTRSKSRFRSLRPHTSSAYSQQRTSRNRDNDEEHEAMGDVGAVITQRNKQIEELLEEAGERDEQERQDREQEQTKDPEIRRVEGIYKGIWDNSTRVPHFLYAIRILGHDEMAVAELANVLAAEAAGKTEQIIVSQADNPDLFRAGVEATKLGYISPDICLDFWRDGTRQYGTKVDPQVIPQVLRRLHRMVTPQEISSFWRLPILIQGDLPDILTDEWVASESSLNLPVQLGVAPDLGAAQSAASKLIQFDLKELAKHTLIIGASGTGKTTTTFHLLHQLWTKYKIPFLVLEPAKREYRALQELFADDLRVFTVGNELVAPFRMNPFEVPDGVLLEAHIGRLNACFVGAFNLFDPLPMLLDSAIREAYREQGWSPYAIGGQQGNGKPVTLSLMRQTALRLAEEAGYKGEGAANIRAALDMRLGTLIRGAKGRMLDTEQGIPIAELLRKPTVLELDLLNADEKALVMMFILTLLYEYVQATNTAYDNDLKQAIEEAEKNNRSAQTQEERAALRAIIEQLHAQRQLRHLLMVEEAHNLIGHSGSGRDRANPKEHAINLFTNMLAEMRALKQGIMIADQLPSALAPQAMKNTNIKILHQLTAGDDREAIWLTMGAGSREEREQFMESTVSLVKGQTFVFMQGWSKARQVDVKPSDPVLKIKTDTLLDEEIIQHHMGAFLAENKQAYMPFPQDSAKGLNLFPPLLRSILDEIFADNIRPEWRELREKARAENTDPSITIKKIYTSRLGVKKLEPLQEFCFYVYYFNIYHPNAQNLAMASNKGNPMDNKYITRAIIDDLARIIQATRSDQT